jgi:hypothetical protein
LSGSREPGKHSDLQAQAGTRSLIDQQGCRMFIGDTHIDPNNKQQAVKNQMGTYELLVGWFTALAFSPLII